jgi:ribosomal protein L24
MSRVHGEGKQVIVEFVHLRKFRQHSISNPFDGRERSKIVIHTDNIHLLNTSFTFLWERNAYRDTGSEKKRNLTKYSKKKTNMNVKRVAESLFFRDTSVNKDDYRLWNV